MRKTSRTKSSVAAPKTESDLIQNDINKAKETRRRLQRTLEELHHAVHQVERNLHSAKELLNSLAHNQIEARWQADGSGSDRSRPMRRRSRSRIE